MGWARRSSPIGFVLGCCLLVYVAVEVTKQSGLVDELTMPAGEQVVITIGGNEAEGQVDPNADPAANDTDAQQEEYIPPPAPVVQDPKFVEGTHKTRTERRVRADGTEYEMKVISHGAGDEGSSGPSMVILGVTGGAGVLIMGIFGLMFFLTRETDPAAELPDLIAPFADTQMLTQSGEMPTTLNIEGPSIGGRYRIVSKLGEGGMAAVYRVWDLKEEEWRAVKVLRVDLAKRGKIRKRFKNEADAMMTIDHRHVIKVFEVHTEVKQPYFVMELARGGCLIDWSDAHGPMPARMAVDVAMQICKGIGAAHAIGVIHRDVKPHNVLISKRGVCKITDFGIAQIADPVDLTKTGSVMGTLGYMAPEQRVNAKDVNETADIYSIAATLYSLLTGGTVTDLFIAAHEEDLLEGIPAALAPILVKATAYQPAKRYGSVAEFAKALHTIRKDLPVVADGTPPLVMPMKEMDYNEETTINKSQETFPGLIEILDPPSAATGGETLLPSAYDAETRIRD